MRFTAQRLQEAGKLMVTLNTGGDLPVSFSLSEEEAKDLCFCIQTFIGINPAVSRIDTEPCMVQLDEEKTQCVSS